MIARAVLRYIRISPRKFRQVLPLVKGKNPQTAIMILGAVKKNAAKYAIDILKSAIANTKRMQGVLVSDLYISKFTADCGPTLKRFRAASMGRASSIRKRTSHIIVELDRVKHTEHKDKEAKAAEGKKIEPVKAVKDKTHKHEAHAGKARGDKAVHKHEHTKKHTHTA